MADDDPFESPDEYLDRLRNSLSGKGVAGRAEVARLAKNAPPAAIRAARAIEHPWYRCQALASIVEANPSMHGATALLEEALETAYAQKEPNRIVSVSYWPLRLLVASGSQEATPWTERLLRTIAEEPHGLRRLDGLNAILAAVVSSQALRLLAFEPFIRAIAGSKGWRTERIVDSAASLLAPIDPLLASSILAGRAPSRFTKRSRALLLQVTPRAGA
jgi:hypothetical protein